MHQTITWTKVGEILYDIYSAKTAGFVKMILYSTKHDIEQYPRGKKNISTPGVIGRIARVLLAFVICLTKQNTTMVSSYTMMPRAMAISH